MDSDRKDRQPVTATISPDVKVTKQGDTVTFTILSAVLFDSGKAQLRADGKAALKQAAREIRSKYAGCPVEVRGHTDNEPIKYSHYASNAELAEARALAVVHYLTQSEGFDSSLMTTIGYADTRPVADNSTAQGRQKNRRAEIIVRTKKVDLASAEPSGS
jgi:chemotaxis protein MotB